MAVTTASLAFQFSGESGLAVSLAVNSILLTVTSPSGGVTTQSLAANATGATFPVSAAGTYSATIQPLTSAGAPVGNPVTQTVNVPAASTQTLVLPTSMTATLS